jgi:ectoine hydroxylase-related dioxygenase (phytanoyl-CoA dioxygenase family)
MLCHRLPGNNEEVREALYSGTVFLLEPTPATRRLVEQVIRGIEEELPQPIREAQFQLDGDEFFERVGRLRKRFYTEPHFLDAVREIFSDFGFDPSAVALDPMRLRVITHRGFENPAAAPIYFAHRDTWYAHSQCEITWWIPLHDVSEEETFVFYPDWFSRPVSNNSDQFDHDRWTRHGQSLRIGWQNPEHSREHLYPGHVGELEPGREVGFAARAGQVLLFSGAHFHQTRKNGTGRTRFSLDFRTVDLADDRAGKGAPNVDNRSTGSATRDYVRPI